MEPIFMDYLDRLNALHTEVEEALEGLPQAGLDWAPGPGMNSIAVLIVHLIGAERYWVGDVASGDPSNRLRETEFQVRGISAEELKRRLYASREYIRSRLETLTIEDLATTRYSPQAGIQADPRVFQPDDEKYTIGYCLLHALEHTAVHAGQIQITRQLWHLRQIA
jgi:uncharacterized damage-inducible protein DinB